MVIIVEVKVVVALEVEHPQEPAGNMQEDGVKSPVQVVGKATVEPPLSLLEEGGVLEPEAH